MIRSEKEPNQNEIPAATTEPAQDTTPDVATEAESSQETLAREHEELKAQHEAVIDQIRRLQAEFINYRNRIERDQEQSKNAANEKLLAEFLVISDNLQLALQHAKDESGVVKGEDLLAGVILINEQLRQLLEHYGLEEIPANGRFDPHLHEALMTVQQQGAERGTVLQTFQRGYTRNGKPFRPAKVSVAK